MPWTRVAWNCQHQYLPLVGANKRFSQYSITTRTSSYYDAILPSVAMHMKYSTRNQCMWISELLFPILTLRWYVSFSVARHMHAQNQLHKSWGERPSITANKGQKAPPTPPAPRGWLPVVGVGLVLHVRSWYSSLTRAGTFHSSTPCVLFRVHWRPYDV